MIPCVDTEIISKARLGETNNLDVATIENGLFFLICCRKEYGRFEYFIMASRGNIQAFLVFLEINFADGEQIMK